MNSLTVQFLKKPFRTGAIWPSSRSLSCRMVSGLRLSEAKTVVELGPGTGAITASILPRLNTGTHFFAVELSRPVLRDFQKKFPQVRSFNDSASHLRKILSREGLDYADVILSGLPWGSFSDSLQDEILSEIVASLPPGGVFTTFAYIQGVFLPAAHHFRHKLRRNFSVVKRTGIVWKNFPPAFCYYCKK